MKKLVVILIVLILFLNFSVTVYAEDSNPFNIIGADELLEIVDENTREFFYKNDIDITDYSFINKITPQNALKSVFYIIKSGCKTPVNSGVILLSIIIITAAFSQFDINGSGKKSADLVITCAICIIAVSGIWRSISAGVSMLKYISAFMLSFIPIFISAVILSGNAVTGNIANIFLLFASQIISFFSSTFILPLMGGYLAVNLSSVITPFESLSKICEAVKKTVIWCLSFVFSIFTGLLGISTSINAQADNLAIKSAKFIIGTCIPIAGTALGEATGTVYASMSILKSSIGVYAIIAVSVAIIPILIEVLLWKAILSAESGISKSFSLNGISMFFDSINSLLSVFTAILIFVFGLIVISLGIIVSVKRV